MADELPPLDPSTLRALDAERKRPDVDDAMGDRLLGRVMASVAVGAAVSAAATTAAASTAGSASAAAAGTTAKMLPWIIAAFVVGGGTGAALHAAFTAAPAPPPPVVVTAAPPHAPTAPTAPAAPATSAAPAISVGELPSAKVDAPKPNVAPSPSSPIDAQATGRDVDLATERALVDRARTALTRGQSGAALDALDAHAKSYPRGRLAEEREALAVDALARAGRTDEARARADRFRTTYPKSVFGGVVDSASPPR